MKIKYCTLTGLVLLVGCGGGGGGGGGNSGSTPLTLKMTDLKAELSENGQTSLKFEINKNGADYSLNLATTGHPGTFDISDVEPGITWSVNDDVLNINAENLDKVSRTAIATLTASHDGQQASATFEIDLKNGSLDEVIETVNVYVNDAQTIVSLSELNDISTAYSKVLNLLGHSSATPDLSFDNSEYLNNLSRVNTALRDVTNGASDTVLISSIVPLENQLNEHANELLNHINSMATIENSLMSLPSVAISVSGGQHSFFVGNEKYGSYDLSSYWKFSNEYEFVGNLINPLYGNCSI